MTILEVYEKYEIMPQLQQHQFKVAGVASIILENFNSSQPPLLKRGGEEVVLACLIHDIGNIIKFDFSKTKSIINLDLDLDFWQKVKDRYIKKYGSDEHLASLAIAKELGVSRRVVELVDCVGFETAKSNLESKDLGKQICAYADMRAAPSGIVSLEERLADLRVRYKHRANFEGAEKMRNIFESSLKAIETEIFSKSVIKPTDITEAAVAPIVLELKQIKI